MLNKSSNNHMFLTYKWIYLLGGIIEPLWGIAYLHEQQGTHDSVAARLIIGALILSFGLLAFIKPDYFKSKLRNITVIAAIAFMVQRYYLLSLNPDNWLYIIDLYTIFILTVVTIYNKRDFLICIPLFIFPSAFFPFMGYSLFYNLITIMPLIGVYKYAFFVTLDRLELAQAQIKNQSILDGSIKMVKRLSHDINNLSATIGLLNHHNSMLLSKDVPDISMLLQNNVEMEKQILRLASLMSTFKSSVESTVPLIEQVDINDLIVDVISKFPDEINRKNIKINLDLIDEPIKSDAYILGFSMETIIKNAIDSLPNNSKSNYIAISTKIGSNDKFCISIENNGDKISDTDKEKLFQPFFTTKEVGYGMGLRLSITKQKLSSIKSSVYYEDKENTVFTISLPLT